MRCLVWLGFGFFEDRYDWWFCWIVVWSYFGRGGGTWVRLLGSVFDFGRV